MRTIGMLEYIKPNRSHLHCYNHKGLAHRSYPTRATHAWLHHGPLMVLNLTQRNTPRQRWSACQRHELISPLRSWPPEIIVYFKLVNATIPSQSYITSYKPWLPPMALPHKTLITPRIMSWNLHPTSSNNVFGSSLEFQSPRPGLNHKPSMNNKGDADHRWEVSWTPTYTTSISTATWVVSPSGQDVKLALVSHPC